MKNKVKKRSILVLFFTILCLAVFLTACAGKTGSDSVETGAGSGENIDSTYKMESWDLSTPNIEIMKASQPEKCPDRSLKRNDTIIIGTSDFSGVFNPIYCEMAFDAAVTELIFDGLVEADYNARPIPGMADYKISDDGLTYTFTLREGLKFSDGTPVTTKDVEFTIYALADPEYYGPYDVFSVGITGLMDYYEGNADAISGIKILDEKKIEFTLDEPNAQAIWLFRVGILSKEYYGKNFKKGDLTSLEALNDKPMGSGQYLLAEYNLGESIKLTAHEAYWKGTPKIKNLIFSMTPIGQEVERVMTGEVDIDFPAPSEDTVKAAQDAGFMDIYLYPTNGYSYLGLNLELDKYQDNKVRQALVYGLNRQAVVDTVFGPYADVINIPQSKLSWAYTEEGINLYEFDLDKAAVLLKEAGWEKDGSGNLKKDGETFKITFTTSDDNPFTEVLIPVMQEDYGKLGIETKFETLDFMTMVDRVLAGEIDMWCLAWDLTPDPDDAGSYHTDGPQNLYNYSNPQVDALWEAGAKELDREKRKKIYHEVYQLLNDDIPCIWLYQRSDMWVVNSRIKNFMVSPYRNWTLDMWRMEIQ
ncbi:MAG: ABC transporter substrate-binding protein [Bacillota bacterium]